MRCVMLMFDSLNRDMLPNYGCDWTVAPNFKRLAQRTATFDQSYVCSMPCMPARRDLHTGRPNFLHRSWGPLEPFDDSMPRILKQNGVHSHLVTDHYHYFEDGGMGYHTKYSSWEFFRGQEGDPWKGCVGGCPPDKRAKHRNATAGGKMDQDRFNRSFIQDEPDWPQSCTFRAGIDHIRRNAEHDNWFLQIETFDPHEPFYSHRQYKDRYPEHYSEHRKNGDCTFDWPPYTHVSEPDEDVEHCKHEYASLLTMCDSKLGDVLDLFDELNLWDDTMLIVWTDHGFFLGENGYWAKVWLPFYDRVAHTPFFIWDPRHPEAAGQRRQSLVQPAIDLAPTVLEYFGLDIPVDMVGKSLAPVIKDYTSQREAAIFGLHGCHVNVTDGRYVYMRGPAHKDNTPLYDYTLMPCAMTRQFPVERFGTMEAAEPFSFHKGARTMKIPATSWGASATDAVERFPTMLFDLENDPQQLSPIKDDDVENRLIEQMTKLMAECDAPVEQYERLGVDAPIGV